MENNKPNSICITSGILKSWSKWGRSTSGLQKGKCCVVHGRSRQKPTGNWPKGQKSPRKVFSKHKDSPPQCAREWVGPGGQFGWIRELLTELKCKKEVWREGWAAQEEYRSIPWAWRGGTRMVRTETHKGWEGAARRTSIGMSSAKGNQGKCCPQLDRVET